MPDQGTVWIGRILRSEDGLSLVLVRGVFQTERDARGLAEAFGCDCLVFLASGQVVELGQMIVVDVNKTPVVKE